MDPVEPTLLRNPKCGQELPMTYWSNYKSQAATGAGRATGSSELSATTEHAEDRPHHYHDSDPYRTQFTSADVECATVHSKLCGRWNDTRK